MGDAGGTVMRERVCLGVWGSCAGRPRGLKCAYAGGEQDMVSRVT